MKLRAWRSDGNSNNSDNNSNESLILLIRSSKQLSIHIRKFRKNYLAACERSNDEDDIVFVCVCVCRVNNIIFFI